MARLAERFKFDWQSFFFIKSMSGNKHETLYKQRINTECFLFKFHSNKVIIQGKLFQRCTQGYNARKVISEVYGSFALQCIVSGR